MAAAGNNDNADFEASMRAAWEAWSQAMQGQGAAAGGDFPWAESIAQWTRLVSTDTPPEVQALGARFQHQAGDWLGMMQQVAARFAGRDTSAAEVAGAWREAVQAGRGEDLLQWMLGAARGGNALNDQPWLREFAKAAQSGFGGGDWLNAPAFGPAREHQARWQALLKIQQDYQARAEAYVDTIRSVLDDAFKRFEAKLAEHEMPGSQLTSARAMFDLWIDAAEEAYAKVALSEDFQHIYGELANAQMRLRAASQSELERACDAMGVPTRTEMDAAHRRIAELERQVRRLMAAAQQTSTPAQSASADKSARSSAGRTAARPAKPAPQRAAKKAAKKATRKAVKEIVQKAAPKKVTANKPAARKPAAKKAVVASKPKSAPARRRSAK
ncbi:class III poly(R)-hydroxyalkanoic acid synthase subunit PhaE [uncultured Stenotrophomonas sp.]|uniref:class III poly(R)-hydroxyalkanoic acid synthase subunit PhaE n=1 Tax=uncultured Stenotrophomonas sp. TaxID=165438 RepID=UPI0025DCC298|nr:class III poly(R)-hydroxyalkanoic acid synthase subunit PhaE [uncultured Stenotrophomonas sp.]